MVTNVASYERQTCLPGVSSNEQIHLTDSLPG